MILPGLTRYRMHLGIHFVFPELTPRLQISCMARVSGGCGALPLKALPQVADQAAAAAPQQGADMALLLLLLLLLLAPLWV